MKIKIFWQWKEAKELIKKSKNSLEELWLTSFIEIEETFDSKLKEKLNIKKEPALIVEEEEIDFLDTIFEWIVPDEEEIKSMFVSIIWWWEWWWCNSGSCGSCSVSWCNW